LENDFRVFRAWRLLHVRKLLVQREVISASHSQIDENCETGRCLSWCRTGTELYIQHLSRLLDLSDGDKKTIEHVYQVFFSVGPGLNYASVSPGPSGPSYEELMTLTDENGHNWSYLAAESNFRFVKEMQQKNLIVPLVGDFAGPKVIRTVGRYLKDHKAIVSAFYLSNVEMYILPSQQWKSFCANVVALPMDTSSTFIRFVLAGYAQALPTASYPWSTSTSVVAPMIDVLTGVVKGYPPSYYELLHASR